MKYNNESLTEKFLKVDPNASLIQIKRYIKFCDYFNQNNCEKGFHRHHILPKGIEEFKPYSDLTKHKWNQSILRPRAHYIAHKILAKALPKNNCAVSSFGYMLYSKYDIGEVSSKDYEYYSLLKSRIQTESKLININGFSKFIHKDDLEGYLEEGWEAGRGNKKRVAVNKDGEVKMIEKSKIDEFVINGWKPGTGKNCAKLYKDLPEYKVIVVPLENIQQYIDEGWTRGIGKSHDKGHIGMYTYGKDEFEIVKVSKKQAEELQKIGYKRGYPRKLKSDELTLKKQYKDKVLKVKTKRINMEILIKNGWVLCEYDQFSGRFIKDGFIIPKSIRSYLKCLHENVYVEDSILIEDNKTNPIRINDLIIHVSDDQLDRFLSNGWEKGTGLETHRNVASINKNGESLYVFKEDLTKYLNDGWEKGTGKSNVKSYKHVHFIDCNGSITSKMVPQKDIEYYIEKGWKMGRPTKKQKLRRA